MSPNICNEKLRKIATAQDLLLYGPTCTAENKKQVYYWLMSSVAISVFLIFSTDFE